MSLFECKNLLLCIVFIQLYMVLLSTPATETAQQLKKTAGVPFHAKGRGLVKKIDTTSKLKINKRT